MVIVIVAVVVVVVVVTVVAVVVIVVVLIGKTRKSDESTRFCPTPICMSPNSVGA